MADREKSEDKSVSKKPGRLRSAVQVLRGEAVVPDQIVWEWVEYKQTFNDLLKRFSASLARQGKADKARALRELPPDGVPQRPVAPKSHKEELRAKAAALRGLPSRPALVSNGDIVPPPPEEDP